MKQIDYTKRCNEILDKIVEKCQKYQKDELTISYHSEGSRGIIYEICYKNELIAHGAYKSLMKYEFKQTEAKREAFSTENEVKEILKSKDFKYIGPLKPYTEKHPGLTPSEKFLYEDSNGFVYETSYNSQKSNDFKFHNTRLHIQSNIVKLNEYANNTNLTIEHIDLNKRTVTFKCKKCGKIIENISFSVKRLFRKKKLCYCIYNNEHNLNIGRNPYEIWTKEKAIDLVNSKFRGQFTYFEIQNPEKMSRMTFVFTLLDGNKTNPLSIHELNRTEFTTLKASNKQYPDKTYEEYVMRRLKEEGATFGSIVDDSDKLYSDTLFWYTDKNGIPRVTSYLPANETLEHSKIYRSEAVKLLIQKWNGLFEYVSHNDDTITRRCIYCGQETTQSFSSAFQQVGECVCRSLRLNEYKQKLEKLPYSFPNIDIEYSGKNSIINGICKCSDVDGYFSLSIDDVFNRVKVCQNCSLSKICKLHNFSHYKHENYIAWTLTVNNIPFKMRDRKLLKGKEVDFIFEINNIKYALEHQGLQHFMNVKIYNSNSYENRHNTDLWKIEQLTQLGYVLIFTKGIDSASQIEFCGYPLKTIYNFLDDIIDNPIYPEEPNLKQLEEIRINHINDNKRNANSQSRRAKAKVRRQEKELKEKQKLEEFNDAAKNSFYLSGVLKEKYPKMYDFWRSAKKRQNFVNTIRNTGNSDFYLISDLEHNPVFTIVGKSEMEQYLNMTYASLIWALNHNTPTMLSKEILEPVFYIKKLNPKEMTEFLRDENQLNAIIERAKNATRICKYNRDGLCVHIYEDKNEYLKEENLDNAKGSRLLRLNNSEYNEHRFKYFRDTNGEAIKSYYPFKHLIEQRKPICAYDYETGKFITEFEYAEQSDEILGKQPGSSAAACQRKYKYTNTKLGRLILRYKDDNTEE